MNKQMEVIIFNHLHLFSIHGALLNRTEFVLFFYLKSISKTIGQWSLPNTSA